MRLRRSWPYCPSCSASPPAPSQRRPRPRTPNSRSASPSVRTRRSARWCEVAARDGLKVKLVEFSDFIQPNAALDAKELDLNIYQHKPFLDAQNKARGYHLVPVATAVVQQMGIYSKRVSKLDDLQPGAKVAIPNDPTNGARALLVLQAARLITLAGRDRDRLAVRYRRESQEPEVHRDRGRAAAALAQDVDAAAVNSAYAIPAGLSPAKDALALESKDAPFAPVVIAAREDNKSDPRIARFIKAYQSDEVKAFVARQFPGAYATSW